MITFKRKGLGVDYIKISLKL